MNKGIILIENSFYVNYTLEIAKFFKEIGFLPYNSWFDYGQDIHNIVGFCEKFEDVEIGNELKKYSINVKYNNNVELTFGGMVNETN